MAHGIGIAKGGRNTRLHAICDEKGRPHVLLLTSGNTHDAKVAILAINAAPPSEYPVADKGYDSTALRSWLIERGATPVIPSKSNRKVQIRHDRQIYRQRNVVERMFCLPLQRLAPGRHTLRPQYQDVHGYNRHRRHRHMRALMCPDPSSRKTLLMPTRLLWGQGWTREVAFVRFDAILLVFP